MTTNTITQAELDEEHAANQNVSDHLSAYLRLAGFTRDANRMVRGNVSVTRLFGRGHILAIVHRDGQRTSYRLVTIVDAMNLVKSLG